MGPTDKAIQTLFKLATEVKKLWENASPDSDFSAQTIPLELSGIWGCLIGFESRTSSNPAKEYVFLRDTEAAMAYWFGNYNANVAAELRARQVQLIDAGVKVNPGYGKTIGSASYSIERRCVTWAC